jgi:signal transduction histidine kinase
VLAIVLLVATAQVREAPTLRGPELRERAFQRAQETGLSPREARRLVAEEQFQALVEREIDQRTLEQLRDGALIGLVGLLALSFVIGYFVSGLVLRPVSQITSRARALYDRAPDLSGRIDLGGPDDELRELADTLDAFLGRTESAVESQRRFLADASHELRTPLTTAQTNLDVVLADPTATTRDLRGAASVAREQLRRMGRLVADLLLTERARAQQAETIVAADLVGEVVAELTPRAKGRDIRLVATGTEGVVYGHREEMRRALTNVVENAIVHNRPGGSVRISSRSADGALAIVVEDDGPGIDPSRQEEIFRRFHRAGHGEGTGLGLAIVKDLIEHMGGSVEVESANGEGARFVLRVPDQPRSWRSSSRGGA